MPTPLPPVLTEPDDSADVVGASIEQALLADLRWSNAQAENTSFTLSIRHPSGDLAGGLTGSTSYGWLLIKTLWIDETERNKGLGRALMKAAEDKARDIGCHGAWLDTSDPNANQFYKRLGYEPFGELANGQGHHPEGHRRWFMKKAL